MTKQQELLDDVLRKSIQFESNRKNKMCRKALLKAIKKWRKNGCFGIHKVYVPIYSSAEELQIDKK